MTRIEFSDMNPMHLSAAVEADGPDVQGGPTARTMAAGMVGSGPEGTACGQGLPSMTRREIVGIDPMQLSAASEGDGQVARGDRVAAKAQAGKPADAAVCRRLPAASHDKDPMERRAAGPVDRGWPSAGGAGNAIRTRAHATLSGAMRVARPGGGWPGRGPAMTAGLGTSRPAAALGCKDLMQRHAVVPERRCEGAARIADCGLSFGRRLRNAKLRQRPYGTLRGATRAARPGGGWPGDPRVKRPRTRARP